MKIGNDIPNTVILNIMTNIRLAGEAIYYLSREAWTEFRRQNRVTKYSDQNEDRETVITAGNGGSNDVTMENSVGGHQNLPTTTTDTGNQHTNKSGGGGSNYS